MNSEIYQRVGVQNRIVGAAESLAKKLNEEIAKGNDDTAFMIAFLLAGFKDFLDIILVLTAVGLIPGVTWGTGLFLSGFLFFFMLGKGWFLKWRLRLGYWVLCWFFDGLPGFNTLPINSLMVLYAWRLAKKRQRKATEKLQELHTMTDAEMEALNNDISLLEEGDSNRAEVTSDRRRGAEIRRKNEEERSKITPLPSRENLYSGNTRQQAIPQIKGGGHMAPVTSNRARAAKIKEKNEQARGQITPLTPRPKPNLDIAPKQAFNSGETDKAA